MPRQAYELLAVIAIGALIATSGVSLFRPGVDATVGQINSQLSDIEVSLGQ